MSVRYFALIFGIFYLLVGIAGLIPGPLQQASGNAPALTLDVLYGYVLGLFPVNILHTLVHLVVGAWGVLAYRSYAASRRYAQFAGVFFLVLALMGVIPGLNTVFGLLPLHGSDVLLHLVSGLPGLVFGFISPRAPAVGRA